MKHRVMIEHDNVTSISYHPDQNAARKYALDMATNPSIRGARIKVEAVRSIMDDIEEASFLSRLSGLTGHAAAERVRLTTER